MQSTRSKTPRYIMTTNEWDTPPQKEIDRLKKTLKPHLRKMGIETKISSEITENILEKQINNCIFGTKCNSIYCWNAPKDKKLKYLKLEWGHLYTPQCQLGNTCDSVDNLALMCKRCNNQIQSSRTMEQLILELQSKCEHIDELLT